MSWKVAQRLNVFNVETCMQGHPWRIFVSCPARDLFFPLYEGDAQFWEWKIYQKWWNPTSRKKYIFHGISLTIYKIPWHVISLSLKKVNFPGCFLDLWRPELSPKPYTWWLPTPKAWGHPKKNFCFRSSGCPFLKPVGRPHFFFPLIVFSVGKYCPFLEKKKEFPFAPF